MPDLSTSSTVPSRRTLARGAAWVTPTLVLVSAARAAAASVPPVVFNADKSSTVCKITKGTKKFQFKLSFTNNGTVSYTVCVTGGSATPNGCPTVDIDTTQSFCCTIAPGKTCTITATTVQATCEAQGTMTLALVYTYTDANGAPHTVTDAASWPSYKPC